MSRMAHDRDTFRPAHAMTDSTPLAADDPFGPQLPPGALYIGSTLQQRIDLIEHLLEFGRQLIVLSGPPGSGKSTLLAAIAQAAGQRWTCVTIQGGPALQARVLLAQIADALDVDLSADGEPRMAHTMLRLRLSVLERAGKLTVLLVDDADELPPDAVAALVALARSEDQAAEARVLMTADQDHAGLLANLQRDRPQHGLVHVVEIPPLAEAQTAEFIAQRLSAVGLELGDCFSHAELQRIAAAAAGNPARVVALARQHHASQHAARRDAGGRGATARTSRSGATKTPPRLALSRLAERPLLLFLPPALFALCAWWWLRDAGVAPQEDETVVALELPTQPAPTPPAAVAPPPAEPSLPAAQVPALDPRLADNGEQELIEIVLPDEPVPPQPAAPPALAAAPVAPPPAAEPPPVAAPAPTPPRPAAAPKPIPKPVPAPAPKPVPAPAPKALGYSADWLLKQPRGAYALQLAGVRDRAAAARFIQRHGLAAETAVLTTRRDGQAWYVLVHGYYPTRQAALAAAARLPAAVRKEVQPWARTIGELAQLPR